ncbi:AAA family ATPase [Pseudomonas sp. S37]|uniref:ATP-binding protein n=1 Tax=Pseudomonas sp. S37 TaxID=2767449 RepID=UPI0019133D1A|nr:ATP-binding protein [Pseudomonas sp. S37]MBK4997307.1 AAA family ATPase [Pseudomonas sp. S37]
MKISNLEILNFRGIIKVSLQNLGDMVVIAGQNGSGKSCIFDAIRLLKSIYGGYQVNEWHQWMGEFQITPSNKPNDLISLFNDPKQNFSITCDFTITESEKEYVLQNAEQLLREKLLNSYNASQQYEYANDTAPRYRIYEQDPETQKKLNEETQTLKDELNQSTITGKIYADPNKGIFLESSVALSIIFGTFRPTDLGVIDYHGPQRHFSRESIQGITLNLEQQIQQRSQTALYNYSNKYSNVKGEMAASYIKEVLAEAAGLPREKQSNLTNTLQELFASFFPDKTFLGPKPTVQGKLTFPVITSTGREHDLDELSSGEKEIIYGYLRIRNSAPQHSIILLDEPELHLNPRLIRELPQFYRKHLGESLNNQLWLVTHSDALLREVVGHRDYSVFHMTPISATTANENQVKSLSANEDVDLALADLVGDLAAYQPNGKIVIFEGGGDSDFDRTVVSRLFPELIEKANLISGTNKTRVRALQEILERAATEGRFPFKVYSITDKDLDQPKNTDKDQANLSWNVYHIENYFLSAPHIASVMSDYDLKKRNVEHVERQLIECAEAVLPKMIAHELNSHANNILTSAINTRTDPKSKNTVKALSDRVNSSIEKINLSIAKELSESSLQAFEETLTNRYSTSLKDNTWKEVLRGRDILKEYVSRHGGGIKYEAFRNFVLAKMADANYQPEGMKSVVNHVLKS